MRKALLVFVVIGVCFILLINGKSDETKRIEERIAGLGEVSLENEDAIIAVRSEYEQLSADDQHDVGNYGLLLEAERKLNQIYAGRIDDRILGIGEIGDNTGAIIAGIIDDYEKLSEAQKNEVRRFGELVEISNKYDDYMTEGIIEQLDVIADIDKISDEEIDALLKNYNELPERQKQLIVNTKGEVNKLICSAREIRFSAALDRLTYKGGDPSKDDIKGIITAIECGKRTELGLENVKERLDKVLKAFGKYINNRDKEDGLYKRSKFIKQSNEIDYGSLLRFPDSYKDTRVFYSVEVLDMEEGGWFGSDMYTVVQEGTDNVMYIYDERKIKEPLIEVGDKLCIYGNYYDMKTVSVYEDGSGWFGSNLFATISSEYKVPCIDLYYTSMDNLGLISCGDPLLDIEDLDEEKEELINRLSIMIGEIYNEEF